MQNEIPRGTPQPPLKRVPLLFVTKKPDRAKGGKTMTQPIVAWIVFCLTFGLGLARFAQQPPEVDPPSQSPPPAEAPPVGPPSPIPEPDAKEAKAEAMSQANPPASSRQVEKLSESPAPSTGGILDGP